MADPQFNDELERFVVRIIAPRRINSLAQTLIKLTAPGVPDIYQGTEFWSLDLVDPDNRRAVDYALRRKLLAELTQLTVEEIMHRSDEGLPKLWVMRQALALRRCHPQWFGPDASYQPLAAQGAYAEHVFGFSRSGKVVTLVPRLILSKPAGWSDTSVDLSSGRWRSELTGETLQGGRCLVEEIFKRFPVCRFRPSATDETSKSTRPRCAAERQAADHLGLSLGAGPRFQPRFCRSGSHDVATFYWEPFFRTLDMHQLGDKSPISAFFVSR